MADVWTKRIFSHAHPKDLIALSRTNKWLRFLLASRSSAYIWRKAVDALKFFPLPPVEVNYFKWLELFYSKTCQKCGKDCEEADFQVSVDATPATADKRLMGCDSCMSGCAILGELPRPTVRSFSSAVTSGKKLSVLEKHP